MEEVNQEFLIPQLGLGKIIIVWAGAAFPMGILGWIVAPAWAHGATEAGFIRLGVLTLGLIWQFILVLLLMVRETGSLRWAVLRQRLWLTQPRSSRTSAPQAKLWWWLVPLVLLTAVYEIQIGGYVQNLWISAFPFLQEPVGFSLGTALGSAEARAQLVGAWGVLALFVVSAVFNTVLGEELLFRGFLLPRMTGVFGKWDWLANGLLFGVYHLHQPWGMLSSAIGGMLLYALPSRYWRSAWFGIIAHSGQSVFFVILILGLVLGLG